MPKSQDYTPIPPAAVMPRMLMECELQRQQMSRTDDDEEACAATAKNNNNDEERQCRICLESDFPHTMIAPCRCKGSSQWVHRDCLDEWRIHEEDRAFSHCTECQFQYHFVDTGHAERQRKLQTRFCWFVSRDVCLVTVVIQIIILSLAWLVRLVDVYNNQVLLHILCPDCGGSGASNDAPPRADTTNSTVIPFDDNTTQGHFNHEEFAIYYAYGFLFLLVCLGMMGSIVLCKNKCQISKIKETYTNNNYQDENNAENNSATTSNEETRGITSGGQNNNNNSNHFEKRNQFYQSQRHRRQQRNDDQQQPSSCCSCCCTPNNAYEGVGPQPYFYYYPTYYGGGGDDCCCCCCCDDNTNDCSADGCCCPSLHHTLAVAVAVIVMVAMTACTFYWSSCWW